MLIMAILSLVALVITLGLFQWAIFKAIKEFNSLNK